MRTKDQDLLARIKDFVVDYCMENGAGPTVREVASKMNMSTTNAFRYLTHLSAQGKIAQTGERFESSSNAEAGPTVLVPRVGVVPCGPLTEEYEFIDGYVRLPKSMVGANFKKGYLLTASGDSMIEAGIQDGDQVLIRQQETARPGDIVVALAENEVTLKRYFPEPENQRVVLHPENKTMSDIIVKDCQIQGVAVMAFKDLEQHNQE